MDRRFPLEVFRFCPACGSGAGRAVTIKRFDCAECGFSYFHNAAAAVFAALKDEAGRILFTIREREPAKGMLDLPGGFVDPLETAEAALAREVREETGLSVRSLGYLGSFHNEYLYGGVRYYTLDLAFIGEAEGWSALFAGEEVARLELLRLDEVPEQNIGFASVRAAVRLLRAGPQ